MKNGAPTFDGSGQKSDCCRGGVARGLYAARSGFRAARRRRATRSVQPPKRVAAPRNGGLNFTLLASGRRRRRCRFSGFISFRARAIRAGEVMIEPLPANWPPASCATNRRLFWLCALPSLCLACKCARKLLRNAQPDVNLRTQAAAAAAATQSRERNKSPLELFLAEPTNSEQTNVRGMRTTCARGATRSTLRNARRANSFVKSKRV